jgi:hypothetical protein
LLIAMPNVQRADIVRFAGLLGSYYAANAGGRLMGILLSGVLTRQGRMMGCLRGSAVMLAIRLAITALLPSGAGSRRVPV